MTSSTNRALVSAARVVAAAVLICSQQVAAHPNCIGDFPPVSTPKGACPNTYADGSCCDATMEANIKASVDSSGATGKCADLLLEVQCGVCHPWSGHLYERLGTEMSLTIAFCDTLYSECATQLNLPSDYCDYRTGGGDTDLFYSYPLVIDDSFNDASLIKAFPKVSDKALPKQPMDMRMTPDGSKWWVAGMEGQIVEMDAKNPTTTKIVLDISSEILLTYEEGLLSFAFSPGFHSTGVFFVSYTVAPSLGSNRLARFKYDPSSAANTLASEEEIITSTPKMANIHSAGWISFKPSSYSNTSPDATHELYWSMGDSGPQYDPADNGQNPETLHGSILRILVDSKTGTKYTVPSSNPFSGGGGRAEICAQGFRNPYRCSFDRLNDDLYCGDVGHLDVETVKKVECGKNYGWRRFEGDRCLELVDEPGACKTIDRSPFTFPEFNYCHPDYYPADEPDYLVTQKNLCGDRSIIGGAIIGGFVYRGVKYNDLLGGNYVFADFQLKKLFHLFPNGGGGWGYGTVKGDNFVGVSSFAEDNKGEIYVIGYKGSIYELTCGDLCDGTGVKPVTPEPAPVPFPTLAPNAAEPTIAPLSLTSSPTVAPVAAKPTLAPLPPTLSPKTVAPSMMAEDTIAPSIVPDTAAPSAAVEPAFTATPAATTAAPSLVDETTAPAAAPQENSASPGPSIAATPAPIYVFRTHAPVGTPGPTVPRTASPLRVDETYEPMPIRTFTEPPAAWAEWTLSPATHAPVAVTPGFTAPPVATATTAPMPMVPEPTVPASFQCDGILSPLGQYCCSASCGDQCGGVGCSKRPGGGDACCTKKIKASGDLCSVTGQAPCRVVVVDDGHPNPVPAPTPSAPSVPADGAGGLVPNSPIPGEPSTSATPLVSAEDAVICDMNFDEDLVPMAGPEKPEVSPPEYLGCFKDSPADRVLRLAHGASDDLTPALCEKFCRDSGADLFGVEYGRQCFCGDSRDADLHKHGSGHCSMPCTGDASASCGGFDAMDAYSIGGGPEVPVGSVYLGCQSDDRKARALTAGFVWCRTAMTVQVCEQFCRGKGAAVYGLQYGHECWCGDDVADAHNGPGVCNYRCSGNASTTCGGFDSLNVYALEY